MDISFNARTNKDYMMINTAIFHLKDGGTITIDRDETFYTLENNVLDMTWHNVYIWEINGYNVFETLAYPTEDLVDLLDGAWVELVLEDDADTDYTVTDITWCSTSTQKMVSGSGKPA